MCGENAFNAASILRAAGSSPRVRGKHPEVSKIDKGPRLIPACAGKTPRKAPAPPSTPAHPRVCGENLIDQANRVGPAGSSPRVRGKLTAVVACLILRGLIPACAGKTWDRWPTSVPTPAHPRVCGENPSTVFFNCCPLGSSPRVRGKRERLPILLDGRGLIPACAGKTMTWRTICAPARAHPRVCGENGGPGHERDLAQGSSPRVRGKPRRRDPQPVDRRLIPACAGKTATPMILPHGGRAHPRVCGENS